jgi:hypothetical protein
MRVPISLLLLAPLVLIVSIDKAGAASLERKRYGQSEGRQA